MQSGLRHLVRRASLVALGAALGANAFIFQSPQPGARVALALELEQKEVTLDVGLSYIWDRYWDSPPSCNEPLPELQPGQSLVGFARQSEARFFGDCQFGIAFQTRAVADMSPLREPNARLISKAWLDFDDSPRIRRGGFQGFTNCVFHIAMADSSEPTDSGKPIAGLIPHSGEYKPDGHKGYDITQAVASWFDLRADNFGLVLIGSSESFHFDTDDTACLSVVSNARINVQYMAEVPTLDLKSEAEKGVLIRDNLTDPLSDNAIRQGPPVFGPGPDPNSPSPVRVATDNQPDLRVGSISVRGRGVNRGSDCDPGKNSVLVEIENAGSVNASDFRVRLFVDGSEVDSEKVNKLENGKNESLEFRDVELKAGQRQIKVVVDAGASVAESSESNNERETQVSCAAE